MDRVISQIAQITNWEYLIALESSLSSRGLMTSKVSTLLDRHARVLSRRYLIQKAKLGNAPLSPAEDEILDVLADAAASLRRNRRLPHNIVKSLRAGGLLAAVKRSVCHAGVLQCRTDFEADGVARGTFEAIVNRHPHEFGPETRRLAARCEEIEQPELQAVG